jgi:hypothetical protein
MEETKTIIGFADGYFFVGKKLGDMLIDCLAIVFASGDSGNGINLVNPIPFSLVRKKTDMPFIPSIPLSKFLYIINLNDDIEDSDKFIAYYKENIKQEFDKYKKEESLVDVNTGESKGE